VPLRGKIGATVPANSLQATILDADSTEQLYAATLNGNSLLKNDAFQRAEIPGNSISPVNQRSKPRSARNRAHDIFVVCQNLSELFMPCKQQNRFFCPSPLSAGHPLGEPYLLISARPKTPGRPTEARPLASKTLGAGSLAGRPH
jgi:hypothetical protein